MYNEANERLERCIAKARKGRDCDECGHPAHQGVCEHDRGDSQWSNEPAVAMGPCGCTHTNEPEEAQ